MTMNSTGSDLRISFNYKHGCIRIFKKVIERMDHPKYVFFSMNADNTVLTIHGTEERNNDCLLVERHREYESNNRRIGSPSFDDTSYAIHQSSPASNMMCWMWGCFCLQKKTADVHK